MYTEFSCVHKGRRSRGSTLIATDFPPAGNRNPVRQISWPLHFGR